MNFSKEQIEKAKSCKTIEEFKSLAKAEGLNLTEEEAKMYFNATHGGVLNDDDLDKVAGGAKGNDGPPPPKFKVGDKVRTLDRPIMYGGGSYFNIGYIKSIGRYVGEGFGWAYTLTNVNNPSQEREQYEEWLALWEF